MIGPKTQRRQFLSVLLALFLYLTSGLENVALNGTASQSSTWASYTSADKAIDGNTDGIFAHNSVTHTTKQASNWWMVNLKGSFTISKVVVWPMRGIWTNRLNNAIVKILANDGTTVLDAFRIGDATSLPKFEFDTDVCAASYVRVELANNFLELAEVQVYGEPDDSNLCSAGLENIALSGMAKQSSTYEWYSTANKAIDGNVDGTLLETAADSLAVAYPNGKTWWMVDLKGSFIVKKIVVWNRTDRDTHRLNNAIVEVIACDGETVLDTFTIGTSTGVIKFEFDMNLSAVSYVRVEIGNEYLQLAEVQVFGEPDDINSCSTDLENVALNGEASQSSTWASYTSADKAIDGNTDGSWIEHDVISIAVTQNTGDRWWMVDLKGSFIVEKIVVWNRTERDTHRLTGAVVKVIACDGTTVLDTFTIGTDSTGVIKFEIDVNLSAVSYVRVENDVEYLQLAEVEVFGFPEHRPQKLDNSWKVGLTNVSNIKKVSIVNKRGLCVGNISGGTVKLLGDDGSTVLGTHTITDENSLERDMDVQGVSFISLEVSSVNGYMYVSKERELGESSISLQLNLYLFQTEN